MLPWTNGLSRQCLKPKAWVQYSGWSSLLSNQHYSESRILILFFHYDEIVYAIFCLTLHMIRGYQVSFSVKTSQQSASKDLKLARYFLLLSLQNFNDQNILTYFGGSHLRSFAAVAEWLNAPVLKPNTWVQSFTW